MLKVTAAATTTKTSPKYFVEGLPKDFVLETESNKAKISGVIDVTKKRFSISTGVAACNFDAAGLREVAEHFAELADLIDGKLKVA